MMQAVSHAREAAAAFAPVNGLRDFFDSDICRGLLADGTIDSNIVALLGLSTDEFQAWRQQDYQGWPIMATILSMDARDRVRGVSQRVLCVTPGPNAPADLESFLHPIAAQLDVLAAGIGGVTVACSDWTQVLRAYVLQYTSDMPGGDKMLNAKGHNARRPNRCRPFKGVHDGKVYRYPPVNPFTKKRLFSIHGAVLMRRTAASAWDDAVPIEAARQELKSQEVVNAIAVHSGIKGYSLFFLSSPADRQRYPHLSYMWKLGPTTLPYDPMHILCFSITPTLWPLVSGKHEVLGQSTELYISSKKTVEAIGQEAADGRPTVPLAQVRSLRVVSVHSSSYKAVDLMCFLLSAGEAVLADRIPGEISTR